MGKVLQITFIFWTIWESVANRMTIFSKQGVLPHKHRTEMQIWRSKLMHYHRLIPRLHLNFVTCPISGVYNKRSQSGVLRCMKLSWHFSVLHSARVPQSFFDFKTLTPLCLTDVSSWLGAEYVRIAQKGCQALIHPTG